MGRKRKRKRHRKAVPPADLAEREMVDDVSATTNPAMAEASAAGDLKEASETEEEEDIRKLLEPFTRDELLDLLADACLRDPALLGPSSSSDRKLFVGNVPERAAHDELRGFFSRFGGIEKGPLGADPAARLFRGYAILFYKTPEGLRKALEEPNKVFDGCELQCRRAHRVSKRKHDAAKPADTGGRSNGVAVAASSPAVQHKDLALTCEKHILSSNPPDRLTAKGESSATATALFHQNDAEGGAGILGAPPVAMAVTSSSPGQSTSSTPPSSSRAALGHGRLSATARADVSLMVPTTIGGSNSLLSLQVQGSGAVKSSGLSSLGASTSSPIATK